MPTSANSTNTSTAFSQSTRLDDVGIDTPLNVQDHAATPENGGEGEEWRGGAEQQLQGILLDELSMAIARLSETATKQTGLVEGLEKKLAKLATKVEKQNAHLEAVSEALEERLEYLESVVAPGGDSVHDDDGTDIVSVRSVVEEDTIEAAAEMPAGAAGEMQADIDAGLAAEALAVGAAAATLPDADDDAAAPLTVSKKRARDEGHADADEDEDVPEAKRVAGNQRGIRFKFSAIFSW
ncbi:hypothetical protein EV715DRAFT_291335 [Schizophyllum commune]